MKAQEARSSVHFSGSFCVGAPERFRGPVPGSTGTRPFPRDQAPRVSLCVCLSVQAPRLSPSGIESCPSRPRVVDPSSSEWTRFPEFREPFQQVRGAQGGGRWALMSSLVSRSLGHSLGRDWRLWRTLGSWDRARTLWNPSLSRAVSKSG